MNSKPLLIVFVTAVIAGMTGAALDHYLTAPPISDTDQATADGISSLRAADKAAISARKAADSTKSVADAAEKSAKDASNSARDASVNAHPKSKDQ